MYTQHKLKKENTYFFLSKESKEHSVPAPLLVCNLRTSPHEIWHWIQYTEGKERLKEEAGHTRLADGSYTNQGDIHRRHSRWVDVHIHTPGPWEFVSPVSVTYTVWMVSVPHCSLKALLEMTLAVGTVGKTHIPGTGEGVRSLWLPGLCGLIGSHVPPLQL